MLCFLKIKMDAQRRSYIMNIRSDIARLEKAQKRDKEAIQVLLSMVLDPQIVSSKKQQLTEDIENRKKEIETLKQTEKDVECGLLDDVIRKQTVKETKTVERKHAVYIDKKVTAKHEKKERREKQNEIWQKQRKDDRRANKRSYSIEYKRYCRNVSSLPDYMKKKLENMPSNKGYIWRDIWFYGYNRPERNQPIIMFEKKRGGVLRIHEINSYETKVYEKQGKTSKRVLIEKKRRNKF